MTVAYVCREHSWHTHDPDSRCPWCNPTPRFSAEERAALEWAIYEAENTGNEWCGGPPVDYGKAEIATLRKMLDDAAS
jgi:hypothetical protein